MQLQYIYIKNYKLLENCEVTFVPEEGYPDHYFHYFINNNFTILVGENGNGKTTLMSFIAKMFNDLQRYHDRILSEFRLKYKIEESNESKTVILEKEENNLFITVEDYLPKSLLLEWHPQRGNLIKEGQMIYENKVTYESIRQYLPSKVITSVFSMHGEYSVSRRGNFIGDIIVENYDIADIYGTNHYKFTSLSKGIYRFLEMYRKNTEVMVEFLNLLNFRFLNNVRIYSRLYSYPYDELVMDLDDDEYDEEELGLRDKFLDLISFIEKHSDKNDGWIDVSDDNYDRIQFYEKEKLIYINDLSFEKNGNIVCLSNMSSGEKMFFIRILSLLSSIEDNSLIIIEEPELHLNPSWTKQIITMLQMLFSQFKVHFLISTHSYSFINTVFPQNILFAHEKKFINPAPNTNTFLANEVEISNMFFENSRKLNYVEDKLWHKVLNSNEDEIEEILGYLGESYTKFKLFNILLEKRRSNNDVES
ncbi:AAA family ATPase [Paenibacillus alvei]|uniref:AAA family ATPase n=1 Tax=Paenibacillus alvei TaxID=44250 RepID=UPI0022830C0D|nr:AAA family ATPase [Paenibacillus alvei]